MRLLPFTPASATLVGGLAAAALLVGCDGTSGPGNDFEPSDIRIDEAGAGDTTVNSSSPRMCLSENGNIYVVWYDDREGGNDIWFQASLNGGEGWLTRPTQVNTGTGAATNPDIACIGNTVFIVWEDASDGDIEAKNIYFSRSDSAGSSWLEEPLRLDADPQGKYMSITPRMVAAGDEVHVVWADVVNGAYDIYAASSTSRGTSFADPVRVDSDQPGSAFSAFPTLAIDGNGTVVVAWEDSRNELNDIYAAVSKDSGASFSEDMRLDGGDDPGSADSFSPRVALGGGHAYVVWHDERNGANSDVLMNWSSDGGSTWQASAARVETDEAGAADSTFPDVAMVGTLAHVVWQDDRNGGYDIFYRSYDGGVARTIEANRANSGEPAEADGELRLDYGNNPGFGNSINVRIEAVQETVVAAWEDRRNDGYNPADPGGEVDPQGYNEVYYNYSDDAGNIWGDLGSDGLHIDSYCKGQKYSRDVDVEIDGDRVIAVWRDGRRGNDDVFFGAQDLGESAEFAPNDLCVTDDSADPQ